MTLAKEVIALVQATPGLTDREITNALLGVSAPQQAVNQVARTLVSRGLLSRAGREDGRIGNYPPGQQCSARTMVMSKPARHDSETFSEDRLKGILQCWLREHGWDVSVAWGKERGIDIVAERSSRKWIIEVKGMGSLPAMRVNYFLSILGETLQRMTDPVAVYSIALPDMLQYRKLWDRLPVVAKERTQISCLFINEQGHIDHVGS